MIKTIFFSTSDRMIPILEKLNRITDVKLCITKKDVKIGRTQEIKENKVKKWCITNNIDYLQIDNLKEENLSTVLNKITEINPDLGVVVDFSYIIPTKIIDMFNNKLINIHYSLLPKYRGASPIQFVILNGEKETGITYQLVHKEMDKGNILMQEKYNIKGTETSENLFEQLLYLNKESLSKFIELSEKAELVEIAQKENEASYTYSPTQPTKTIIFKEDAYTTFTESAEILERKIRAFNPRPILWSSLKLLTKYKNIELKDITKSDLIVKIYEGKLINNTLEITTLQVEGKNKMSWEEFINGYIQK